MKEFIGLAKELLSNYKKIMLPLIILNICVGLLFIGFIVAHFWNYLVYFNIPVSFRFPLEFREFLQKWTICFFAPCYLLGFILKPVLLYVIGYILRLFDKEKGQINVKKMIENSNMVVAIYQTIVYICDFLVFLLTGFYFLNGLLEIGHGYSASFSYMFIAYAIWFGVKIIYNIFLVFHSDLIARSPMPKKNTAFCDCDDNLIYENDIVIFYHQLYKIKPLSYDNNRDWYLAKIDTKIQNPSLRLEDAVNDEAGHLKIFKASELKA